MGKSVIAEGKTTNEAIEKGLKELNVSKNNVDVKVLESEDKRSFFSILAPRIVKVELTLKDKIEKQIRKDIKKEEPKKEKRKEFVVTEKDIEQANENLQEFFKQFEENIDLSYEITNEKANININIKGENIGFLIGYRGEALYSLQNILTSIANKKVENRVKIILDIEGYKEKREKTLEELAVKMAKRVFDTGKSVKLEPMQAYERKIIHSKLQEDERMTTSSVGEEPNRRIVISLKSI